MEFAKFNLPLSLLNGIPEIVSHLSLSNVFFPMVSSRSLTNQNLFTLTPLESRILLTECFVRFPVVARLALGVIGHRSTAAGS
jgi:hypothetical protein